MKLGILGGGQLGRMLALAAQPLGVQVTVVDPNPDAPAKCCARLLLAEYDDPTALAALAESDVVTFEFENVPDVAAAGLAARCPVYPSPRALSVAQDRFVEKSTFQALGIPTPEFVCVDSDDDLARAFATLGPLVLKTRRLGYDGKGQRVVKSEADVVGAFDAIGRAPAIAEKFVRFDRELSVIVCRGRDGQSVVYPLTENVHASGILRKSTAPAPRTSTDLEAKARGYATRLVDHFDYVGVLALELFECEGQLVANEFAPRVHNSGHWTIEGARTSQFENHVRAVLGLPLGDPSVIEPSVMLNCIGAMPERSDVLRVRDAHHHDYGKEPRRGRKVGHVTVRAPDAATAEARAAELTKILPPEPAD